MIRLLDKARFILSRKTVLEQYKVCENIADSVSYSFKTNNEVGKVLESETGCNFILHMPHSVPRISDKKRIWFYCQGWDKKEISWLLDQGVRNFIVDNEPDLRMLLENAEQKVNILLRMRLKENTIHTGKYYVFGMYSDQVNRLIPELRKNGMVGKLGIHFYRKTQNISEWSLKQDISELLDKETLDAIDIMNIGGGIPSEYKNFRTEVMDYIFRKIAEMKAWLNSQDIEMHIEPGRFIAAPSVRIEARIVNIYGNNIIVNASVYNSALDTFVCNIRLLVDGELSEGEGGEPYTIKGSTPCSMDIFRYRVFLKEPKVGDKIVFLNAGAYNYSTDFCNLEKLDTAVVD